MKRRLGLSLSLSVAHDGDITQTGEYSPCMQLYVTQN